MKFRKYLAVLVLLAVSITYTCGSKSKGGSSDDIEDPDANKAYEWNSLQTSVSEGEAESVSLAIDKSGMVYVAYCDYKHAYRATVKKLVGNSWTTVGTEGLSSGTAYSIDLAIDLSGVPYIVYEDWANGNRATVKKFNATTGIWDVVGPEGFTNDTVYSTSIAIDSAGAPYVAFEDWYRSGQASVMKFYDHNNDGIKTWNYIGVNDISSGYAYTPKIAISASNVPYIVFQDYMNNFRTTVMRLEGDYWQQVGTPDTNDSFSDFPDIALAPNGTPWIIYSDYNASYKAVVKMFNGTTWGVIGGAGFSIGDAMFTKIAVDSNNMPFVIFSDYGNDRKATVMKAVEIFPGSPYEWDYYGFAGISSGEAMYTDIAVSPQGVPYAAYVDCEIGNKVVVKKFNNTTLYDTPCQIPPMYNGGYKVPDDKCSCP